MKSKEKSKMEYGTMEYGSKPRVAELIRNAEGGMKEHYMTLIKGLIDSGFDVIALCRLSKKDRNRLTKWGAIVVPFTIRSRISPIRSIFTILRLARLLRKYKADILHCHGFWAGFIGRIAALLARRPCIYTIHNFLPGNLGRWARRGAIWIEEMLSGITKSIIAVSGALKNHATLGLGIDPHKIRIIYNGIHLPEKIREDQDIKRMWGIDKGEKLVGTVARLIPAKGLDVLIDAVPMVLREFPDTKFMIVGDGPVKSALVAKASNLKCDKNIIFVGHSEYIWYYYRAFDIFVLPYTVNKEGCGPAWANSLFEDNAEYGYGMLLGVQQNRDKLVDLANEAIEANIDPDLTAALNKWLENKDLGEESQAATKELLPLLAKHSDNAIVKAIYDLKQYLVKKSQWILGGDGWAYDIGFGGLDHVLASGADVNVLVFDTEVYSNTGGQASKSTPTAAVAKFAAAGKRIRKKDLGRIAMSYGYVYVAQIGLGADMNHTIRVLKEAEAYPGPSLIIAYSPCIAHGIRGGMTSSSKRTKLAVQSGYWHLYRYNPLLKEEGKNPFILDSKEPTESFQDFLKTEVRYSSLAKTFPEVAEEFFQKAEQDAKERYRIYKAMSESPIA
jgi:pyruvate/2-oxoacid:ferredoxin oxidoreductase beta subunit